MTDTTNISDLKPHDIRELKGKLHTVKPSVVIHNSDITHEIIQTIEQELNSNELIKIRTHVDSSEELATIAEEICSKTKAALIQTIGFIIAIYRENLVTEE